MSVMEKIFGTFMNSTANQQQVQQPQQGTVVSPVASSIPAGAGATDPNNTTVPASTAPESPLKDFANLWEPNASTEADKPLFGEIDPAKLMEAAKKTNFSGAITKEQLAKIQAGGQDAAEAFQQSMNAVAQTVFANSAMATTKIVEQALERQRTAFEAKLPGIIKQHTASDSLRSENPIFNDPAVAPLVKAMEHQFAQKYPNATTAELTQHAKTYISGLGSVFSPQKKEDTADSSKGTDNTDWSKFFGD
jgi:hypothetical protein